MSVVLIESTDGAPRGWRVEQVRRGDPEWAGTVDPFVLRRVGIAPVPVAGDLDVWVRAA